MSNIWFSKPFVGNQDENDINACTTVHIIENKIDRLSHQLLIVEDTRTRNNVLCWVKKYQYLPPEQNEKV